MSLCDSGKRWWRMALIVYEKHIYIYIYICDNRIDVSLIKLIPLI
jgi:hypothetical protein